MKKHYSFISIKDKIGLCGRWINFNIKECPKCHNKTYGKPFNLTTNKRKVTCKDCIRILKSQECYLRK